MAKLQLDSQVEMARRMKMTQGHLSAVMNATRTAGLEFAIRLAEIGHESLDLICLEDPSEEFYPPGTHPRVETDSPPRPASSSAQPKRRRAAGH